MPYKLNQKEILTFVLTILLILPTAGFAFPIGHARATQVTLLRIPPEVYAWQPSILFAKVSGTFGTLGLRITFDVNVKEPTGLIGGLIDPAPQTMTLPLISIPWSKDWYITAVPGLPADDYEIPVLLKTATVNITSTVKYELLVDGIVKAFGQYDVKKGMQKLELPPVVFAMVYDVVEHPDLIIETQGLGPKAWVKDPNEPQKILIIAYDDKDLVDIEAKYAVSGGPWMPLDVSPDLTLGGLIVKLVGDMNGIIQQIENVIRTVKSDFDLPKIGLPLAVYSATIPGHPLGNYVQFRAKASDVDGKTSYSPIGQYYVVNKGSDTRILIIDPHVKLYLLQEAAKPMIEKFSSELQYRLPDELVKDFGHLTKIADLFQKYGISPFHHWEVLGKHYDLYISWPEKNLGTLLNEFRPHAIVLSNLWLGIDDTPFEWDLRDLEVDDDLISYVRKNHAGIIATHGTLNDLKSYDRDIGVPGHVGESVEDFGIMPEKNGCRIAWHAS